MNMKKTFTELNIQEALIQGLEKQGILEPTTIQETVIPSILSGEDSIISSQTGSGKTLSYLLPIFAKMDMEVRGVQALILTPTHELSAQVFKQAQLLEKNSGIEVGCMLMIGSAGSKRQLEKLKAKPRIIIGSTGRILDFIERKKLPAHLVKTIICDEGDRLLSFGNIDDLKRIIKATLKERQLVVLSASIDIATEKEAKSLMKDTARVIKNTTDAVVPKGIEHYYILTEQRDKFVQLRKVLAIEDVAKVIVFLNNPENIEVTVDKLCHHQIPAVGFYGQVSKEDRKMAMEQFRGTKAKVLVCSDIGARGLDLKEVTHIVNMDVPEEPTHYLHRAGRCGRNGAKGIAITLVTPYEKKWVNQYARVWGISFEQKEMRYGKLVESQRTKKDLMRKEVGTKAEQKPEKSQSQQQSQKFQSKPKALKPKASESKEEGFFAKKAKKQQQKEQNRKQHQKTHSSKKK